MVFLGARETISAVLLFLREDPADYANVVTKLNFS